ncbi:MAG: hypothetical protein HY909_23670 [Deltaproteobacteria bacterium]|nr:hypothetical protein [Deltaproteobacteria bacterium]
MARFKAHHCALGLLALAGCTEDLEQAWKIRRFRLFGASVENLTRRSTDPGATEAAPGETVRLQLYALDPSPAPRARQVVWVFCPQTRRQGSTFGCPPSAGGFAMGDTVDYVIPRADYGVDGFNRARIQAVALACSGGVLGLDATTRLPTCAGDGAESWTMLRSVLVRLDEAGPGMNHNPRITGVALYRGGDLQRAPEAVGEGTRVPRCAAGGACTHVLELQVGPGDREVFPQFGSDGMAHDTPERLQFLFATTQGSFDGSFRVDSAARPEGPIRNTWTAPSEAGAARMVFTAQDLRGGFALVERTITVE